MRTLFCEFVFCWRARRRHPCISLSKVYECRSKVYARVWLSNISKRVELNVCVCVCVAASTSVYLIVSVPAVKACLQWVPVCPYVCRDP